MTSRITVSTWFGLLLLVHVRRSFTGIAAGATAGMGGGREEGAPTRWFKDLKPQEPASCRGLLLNSIQRWLQQHEDLALQAKRICERARASGARPANWGDTTEGRVCAAAFNTAIYPRY